MVKGLCGSCGQVLTQENTTPAFFKRRCGKCRACNAAWRRKKYAEDSGYHASVKLDNKESTLRNSGRWLLRRRKQYKEDLEFREKRKETTRRYALENPEKIRAYSESMRERHKYLRYRLKKEDSSKDNLLWNLNFYSELIKDAVCHYCRGPLERTALGLDRLDSSIGHECYNVVPCCKSCNQKKMHDTSYEEMMLLAPALREIRRRRELKEI